MEFATLPQEVKNANAVIVKTEEQVKVLRLKQKELLSSPQYQGARKILQEQGAKLREQLSKEVSEKLLLLKALKPTRQGNGSKTTYTFKVVGQEVEIVNNKKTLKVALSEVGYNTAFIGNDS